MKTAIRIIAAGLAASLALVSCAKQEAMDNGSTSPAGGVRTIAVSFANSSTKSTLEGFQPKFVGTDVIKVSNGSATEECTVEIDGSGNASITTELTGALTMVYPATSAKMNGNAIDGILVPTVQDGSFASANICKAIIAEKATEASFENQTALFKITPPDGIKKFTITSLKPVVDGVARTGTAVAINTEGADDAAKLVITVGGDASELTTFYVSLVEGVNLTDLSFEYKTDETHGAMKGIPAKSIQAPVVDKTATSTLYTIDSNNWHEYVVLEGKKWATMNIGATSSTDAGLYFMWGETSGMPASSISSTNFPASKYYTNADNSSWDKTKGFGWANTPWTDGVYSFSSKNVFTKYTGSKNEYAQSGTADGKTTLELEDDAANVNWGGSWRMPTEAEFDALASETKVWDSTNKGCTFGTSPNTIFLPAAGFGNGTDLLGAGGDGDYWSSSLHTVDPYCAYYLGFDGGGAYTDYYIRRYLGLSVRALSE